MWSCLERGAARQRGVRCDEESLWPVWDGALQAWSGAVGAWRPAPADDVLVIGRESILTLFEYRAERLTVDTGGVLSRGDRLVEDGGESVGASGGLVVEPRPDELVTQCLPWCEEI